MKKTPILHPFLFAMFPILFLFAHNLKQVRFIDAVPSLIIILLSCALFFLLLKSVLKDDEKAGLILSFFWLSFFSYGHVYDLVNYRLICGIEIGQNEYLIPAYGIFLIMGIYFISRVRAEMRNLTKILNFTAASLIAISLINIAIYEFKNLKAYKADLPIEAAKLAKTQGLKEPSEYPDIYCIILDEYGALKQIRDIYGYDNKEFYNRLVKKGFYIAEKSKIETPGTAPSLAALLSMRLPQESDNPYEMIRNNEVAQFLKSRGYKYIHFGAWCPATIRSRYADFNFNSSELENEFLIVLASTSMLRPLFYSGTLAGRGRTLYAFDKLAKIPEMDVGAPKFVFAHIACPHPPFVFGPNGEKLPFKDRDNWDNKSLYLGQYIFMTKKAEQLIDSILSKSKKPPVIILQSDHGVIKHSDFDVGNSREILNTYYLPNDGKKFLYPSIAPVNSFRLIFNIYFDTDYELLN